MGILQTCGTQCPQRYGSVKGLPALVVRVDLFMVFTRYAWMSAMQGRPEVFGPDGDSSLQGLAIGNAHSGKLGRRPRPHDPAKRLQQHQKHYIYIYIYRER